MPKTYQPPREGSYGLRKCATDNAEGFSNVSAGNAKLSDINSDDGASHFAEQLETLQHFVRSNSSRETVLIAVSWCCQGVQGEFIFTYIKQ
jgi:hypothetical protein